MRRMTRPRLPFVFSMRRKKIIIPLQNARKGMKRRSPLSQVKGFFV
jgi:hypothetical protein